MLTNGLGLGKPIDGTRLANAAWLGVPNFTAPVFDGRAIVLIAPVALILVAENLGHLKAVAATTGRDMDPYIGRAFLGDAVATMVSGSVGGTGTTTYAENIGVMAATRIYSTALFVVAGLFAILLGFSPKFGAVIQTIPLGHGRRQHRRVRPDLGGWRAHLGRQQGRLLDSRNMLVAAITLVLGTGDFTLRFGGFAMGGIGTATFGAILLTPC